MEALSEAESAAVQAFMEITQVSDSEESARLLQRFDWNVDLAVDNYLTSGFRTPAPNEYNSDADVATQMDVTSITGAAPQQDLVLRVSRQLPTFLQRWTTVLSVSVPIQSAESETRNFLTKYENTYGEPHPAFFEGSFQQTVRHALTSYKFVCIYLHSPLHEDSSQFCTTVLAEPRVIDFLARNTVFWAGSVASKEAYQLSMEIQVSTYPCVCMLLYRSERDRFLVEKIEGLIDVGTFLERLQNSAAAHSVHLRRLQDDAARAQEAQMLRQEQDREYDEAMRADQMRREQEDRQQREEQRRWEDEQRAEVLKAQLELQRKKDIEVKRLRVSVEPPAEYSARVRVQMPNGAKLDRRFLPQDTVQHVREFLEVYVHDNNIPIVNFSISTHYPKRTLSDPSQTIEEAGLMPQGMLYVQDLDS